MASCSVCMHDFDADEHSPLLSPCGHTLCRTCASQVRECPFCRSALPRDRGSLPRNFALLDILEAHQETKESDQLPQEHWVLAALGADAADGESSSPSAPVLPSEKLQLSAMQLGIPGSGRVVLAQYRNSEVAVKLLPLSGPPAAREALLREVRLLARVSASCHHTVRLLGVTVKDGALALVMRRYPASLAQHVDRQPGGCLSPGRVLLLAQDLLRGLSELHGLGVVMADLKPDNVMLDEGGAPLLADFGIARAVTATVGPHTVTSPQGSLNYMAPEQFSVGEADVLTPQSDMWALGTTLLHALTGRPPWAGLHMGQITMQVGVNRRSPDLPPNLPGPLRTLLQGCLRPDPRERPSAAAALAALSRELELRLQRDVGEDDGPGGSAYVAAAAAPAATAGTSTGPSTVHEGADAGAASGSGSGPASAPAAEGEGWSGTAGLARPAAATRTGPTSAAAAAAVAAREEPQGRAGDQRRAGRGVQAQALAAGAADEAPDAPARWVFVGGPPVPVEPVGAAAGAATSGAGAGAGPTAAPREINDEEEPYGERPTVTEQRRPRRRGGQAGRQQQRQEQQRQEQQRQEQQRQEQRPVNAPPQAPQGVRTQGNGASAMQQAPRGAVDAVHPRRAAGEGSAAVGPLLPAPASAASPRAAEPRGAPSSTTPATTTTISSAVRIPVDVHLVDAASFSIVEPPVLRLTLPVLAEEDRRLRAEQGPEEETERVMFGDLHVMVLNWVPVPREFQRLLVKDIHPDGAADGVSGSSRGDEDDEGDDDSVQFVDWSSYLDDVSIIPLKSFAGPDGQPRRRQLLVVDSRVPLPRVAVVLHGSAFGSRRVGNVEVDFTFGGKELAAAAVHKLRRPNQQHIRACGPFLPMPGGPDSPRRFLPRLLGSGFIAPGGEVHVGAKEDADQHVRLRTISGQVSFQPMHKTWLVWELMKAVEEEEGVPVRDQELTFRGRRLQPRQELAECGITGGGGTIHANWF